MGLFPTGEMAKALIFVLVKPLLIAVQILPFIVERLLVERRIPFPVPAKILVSEAARDLIGILPI
jgi:hypothetical protein